MEDRAQKRLAEVAVQLNAAFQVPADRVLARQHDDSAGVLAGEVTERVHKDIDLAPAPDEQAPRTYAADHTAAGQLFEDVLDLLLKDHDDGDQDDGEEPLEHADGQ